MERLNIYLLVFFTLLLSCKSHNRLTIKELKMARQIYCDDKGIICLYTYDKWGEDNSIKVYDEKLNFLSEGSFGVEPIPFLFDRNVNSITLEYYPKQKKASYDDDVTMSRKYLSSLGRYNVKYRYVDVVKGESVGSNIIFDKMILNKKLDSIMFFRSDSLIKHISLKNFVNDGNYNCVEIINGVEYYHKLIPSKQKLIDDFYTKIMNRYQD